MTRNQRREAARPIVARVLKETRGQSSDAIARALQVARPPFWNIGVAYTAWCEEVAAQVEERRRYEAWLVAGGKGHTQQEKENSS